jgi:hypothetical protein
MKRHVSKWKKIFLYYTSHEELMPRLLKNKILQLSDLEKKQYGFRRLGKIWTDM